MITVILDKNIKYKGKPHSKGDRISIDKTDLKEFISKKVVNEDLMNQLEELQESQATEDDLKEGMEDVDVVGIDDFTKDQIIKVLMENGIEHNNRDNKSILYKLMIENV